MSRRPLAVAVAVAAIALPGAGHAEGSRHVLIGGGVYYGPTPLAVHVFHGIYGFGGTVTFGTETLDAECVTFVEAKPDLQPSGYRWMIGGSTRSGSFRGTVVIGDGSVYDRIDFVAESDAPLCSDPGFTGGDPIAGATHTISL